MSRKPSTPLDRALTAANHMATSYSDANIRIGLAAHVMALAEEVRRLRGAKPKGEARRKRSELTRYREALPGLIGCAGGDFKSCGRNHAGCCERRRLAEFWHLAPNAQAAE